MTTKEIQDLVGKAQVEKGHSPVVTNLSFLTPAEMDVMSMTQAGFMYEFEVKVSRADYRKDSEKKKKHTMLSMGMGSMPNYFYYVCPAGLIKMNEVPAYAGLMYVDKATKSLVLVKLAPRLHDQKHDLLKVLSKVCRVHSERIFLGGCKLTVKNNKIKATRKERLEKAGFTGEALAKAIKSRN